MTDDFAAGIARHRWLCILRALAEDPAGRLRRDLLALLVAAGGCANLSLLKDGLDGLDHPVSRDQVATVAAWIVEQGLAVPYGDGTTPGWHVTDRGAEAARGRAAIPGIATPADKDVLMVRLVALAVRASHDQVAQDVRDMVAAGMIIAAPTGGYRLTKLGAGLAAGAAHDPRVKEPSFSAMLNAAVAVSKTILGG